MVNMLFEVFLDDEKFYPNNLTKINIIYFTCVVV